MDINNFENNFDEKFNEVNKRCIGAYNISIPQEVKKEFKQFFLSYLKDLKEEQIKKINERKDKTREITGAFKYDWCYKDCIKIINK